jgi:hypothetical protein
MNVLQNLSHLADAGVYKLWERGREAGYFLQLDFKSQKGKNEN